MKVSVDEKLGCVIIDDVSEGVNILSDELYQGYLQHIKDLEKEVADLKAEVSRLQTALESNSN